MEREMVEHNVRLLEKKIREIGFPEEVLPSMREKVLAGKGGEYLLSYETKLDGKPVKGEFHLVREGVDKPYELTEFRVNLGKDSLWRLPCDFPVSTGYDFTLREAVNLMQGRAVWREPAFDPGGRYWVALSSPDPHRGTATFDYWHAALRAEEMVAISGLADKLTPDTKKDLVTALNQGDRKEVSLESYGVERKVWVEVELVSQRLLLMDRQGKQVQLPELGRNVRDEDEVTLGRSRGRGR